MNANSLIWIGAAIGSGIGGFLPTLWGGDMFSITSIMLSTIGGLAGVWLGFKLSRY